MPSGATQRSNIMVILLAMTQCDIIIKIHNMP
jgi:hypothetical protein